MAMEGMNEIAYGDKAEDFASFGFLSFL